MVLATAEFVALPVPEGCGALEPHGRDEQAQRADPLRYFLLIYPEGCSGAGGLQLTYLPPLLITALA